MRDVYLVKKHVHHFPHLACYVLAFRVEGFWQRTINANRTQIMHLLHNHIEYAGETLIINIQGDNKHFKRTFTARNGAKILG